MNKRKEKKGYNMIIKKNKEDKRNSFISFDDLPNVLIRYLSYFFELDSLIKFSSTNKRNRVIFFEFRIVYSFLNKNQFFSKKDPILLQKILKKEYNEIKSEVSGFSLLHFACFHSSFEMIKYFLEEFRSTNKL